MPVTNDILSNKLSRLNIASGVQPAKGFLTKHQVDFEGVSKRVRIQVAVGQASWWDAVAQTFRGNGWNSLERLYYANFEIDPANYHFHSGGAADAPDPFFSFDIPHPKASYYSAQLPDGVGTDDDPPDRMVGIFKTGKFANYDGAGAVTDAGSYSPSPARFIADLRARSRRSLVHVNWPVWLDYRDFCAELIPWDDGALTPHYISLAASVGGSLAPGTYWVRVAAKKAGDISSASKDRANDEVTTASVVIGGPELQFTVEWNSQEERGADGYSVYVGTSEGGQDKFFDVAGGATTSLLITTLAGASSGVPPESATGALLRQVPRFESHLFFPPPFGLATALDRIAQITCMDWHYSGGKQVFLTPEIRGEIFTLNVDELNGFRTWRTERSVAANSTPNQIVGIYRDLDSEFLEQADPPVVVNRPLLQAKEGVRSFEINFGCAYRSQVERGCHYWARRLIDSDQKMECVGSPRTYIVLPGDSVTVTHNVPDWEDVSFYIESKEEAEDSKAGYPLTARTAGEWYSDTDSQPLPRPLPAPNPSIFVAPPAVEDVDLTEIGRINTTGVVVTVIHGGVQFANYVGHQRGRVWWAKPSEADPDVPGDYDLTDITLIPDPATQEAAFELHGVAIGTHAIKVVTESVTGGVSLPFGDHTEFTIDITGESTKPATPINLAALRISTDLVSTWDPGDTIVTGVERYVWRLRDATTFALIRTHLVERADALPCKWAYAAGAGDQGDVSMDPDGTIECATGKGGQLSYKSQEFFLDGDVEWDVDIRHIGSITVVDGNTEVSTGVMIWNRAGAGPTDPMHVAAEGFDVDKRRLAPNSQLSILIRNNHTEYAINGQFWKRSAMPPIPASFKVFALFLADSTLAEDQAMLRVRVRPTKPRQFVYTEAMQAEDFPSGIPATVKVEVTRLAENGLVESDPASIVA